MPPMEVYQLKSVRGRDRRHLRRAKRIRPDKSGWNKRLQPVTFFEANSSEDLAYSTEMEGHRAQPKRLLQTPMPGWSGDTLPTKGYCTVAPENLQVDR